MYVDVLGGRDVPAVGWYLQAIGRTGKRNTAYLVLTCYQVKRRDPRAAPRYQMDVEEVSEVPVGAQIFEFRWYPRTKRVRKRLSFEEHIRRAIPDF